MTVIAPKIERDWLAELRAAADDDVLFNALVVEIGKVAPGLRDKVIENVRERSGDEGVRWAERLFISPAVQPGVEPEVAKPDFRAQLGAAIGDQRAGPVKRRRIGEAPRHEAKAADEAVIGARPKLEGLALRLAQFAPKAEPKPTVSQPAPAPEVAPATSTGLVVTRQTPLAFQHTQNPSGLVASLENAIVALNVLALDCRYDEFHDRIIVKGHESAIRGDVYENLENITLKLRQTILIRFGFDPKEQFTFAALKLRCFDHIFDPVRDYLDGLQWDGRPRLDEWLTRYCGADDNDLNRAIARKMLTAAVRRVRSPGCKFDYIVVLEGEQGIGKSSLLKTLAAEENFSDNEILGLDKQEQQEAVQGVWIYEIGELDGIHKSDVTKVKLFASKTVDSARPAYGRSRVDRPRRCIFVATTNEDTYLRDTTGNRRFWPVKLSRIDLAAVARDRDQLWAEAAVVEAQSEPLVIAEALWPDAAVRQIARMEVDPWEDVIAKRLAQFQKGKIKIEGFVQSTNALSDPEWRVSTDFLLTDVLNLPKERQSNNHTKRLAGIMRGLGWVRPDCVIRFGKTVGRGFVKAPLALDGEVLPPREGCERCV